MTIVAAVGDDTSDAAVVREGRHLAERLGEDLYVVHVMGADEFVDLERSSIEQTGEAVGRDDLEALAGEVAEAVASEALDDESAYEVAALVGDLVEELSTFAEEHDVDYLVIGGRKRSRVGKVVFGSRAQAILLNYDRPVVSVRVPRPD